VGAVGALASPPLEQPLLPQAREQAVEKGLRLVAGAEAGAELGEDGEVEAGVVEFQPQGVLPVESGADGVGGLAVGQVLQELHQRDQGQAPGGEGGLAAAWVEVGEVLIGEEGPQLLAQAQAQTAPGEGGAGDAGGLFRDGGGRLGVQAHGRLRRRAGMRESSSQVETAPPQFVDSIRPLFESARLQITHFSRSRSSPNGQR